MLNCFAFDTGTLSVFRSKLEPSFFVSAVLPRIKAAKFLCETFLLLLNLFKSSETWLVLLIAEERFFIFGTLRACRFLLVRGNLSSGRLEIGATASEAF